MNKLIYAYLGCICFNLDPMLGGNMLDNCSVVIMKNGTNTHIALGCIEKTKMAANCGKQVVVNGVETNVCCCDSTKCNDDAFIKKCQEKPAPTQPVSAPTNATQPSTTTPVSKSYIISASFAILMTALFMSTLMI